MTPRRGRHMSAGVADTAGTESPSAARAAAPSGMSPLAGTVCGMTTDSPETTITVRLFYNPQAVRRWKETPREGCLAEFVFPKGLGGELAEIRGETAHARYYREQLAEGLLTTFDGFITRIIGGHELYLLSVVVRDPLFPSLPSPYGEPPQRYLEQDSSEAAQETAQRKGICTLTVNAGEGFGNQDAGAFKGAIEFDAEGRVTAVHGSTTWADQTREYFADDPSMDRHAVLRMLGMFDQLTWSGVLPPELESPDEEPEDPGGSPAPKKRRPARVQR